MRPLARCIPSFLLLAPLVLLPLVVERVLMVVPAVALFPVLGVVSWLQALKDASLDYLKKMTTNSVHSAPIGCPNQDFPLPTKSNRVRPIGRMVSRLELVMVPELGLELVLVLVSELARFALSLVPVRTGWVVAQMVALRMFAAMVQYLTNSCPAGSVKLLVCQQAWLFRHSLAVRLPTDLVAELSECCPSPLIEGSCLGSAASEQLAALNLESMLELAAVRVKALGSGPELGLEVELR